jgi:hypothetical protein
LDDREVGKIIDDLVLREICHDVFSVTWGFEPLATPIEAGF